VIQKVLQARVAKVDEVDNQAGAGLFGCQPPTSRKPLVIAPTLAHTFEDSKIPFPNLDFK
jgi:hypothetical protein